MKRYKISWRVTWTGEENAAPMRAFIDTITKEGQIGDEVWFFISEPTNFAYEPLDSIAEKCRTVRPMLDEVRRRGIRPVINPWPTFGDENVACIPRELPFQPMVGYDGTVARRVACPVSPEFLEYTRQRYRLFAETGAASVWVDDDCRFTHLGVPYPCFCPACVAGFEDGAFADRESLVAALNRPENGALRRKWSAYGAARLAKYCAAVRSAVDEVDPAIETPFMSVGYSHTSFSGDYIEQCMNALRAKAARPGHGFYWDAEPMELFEKSFDVSQQIVNMPAAVREDVQYEEESHPGAPFNKTPASRLLEMALSVWAGCTGMAMHHYYEAGGPAPMGYMKKEAAQLRAVRPFFDWYLSAVDGLPQSGIWAAYSEWQAAGMEIGEEGWFHESGKRHPGRMSDYDTRQCVREWPCFGTPVTCDPAGAYATLLQGRTPEVLTDAELDRVLSGPVIMDGPALEALWKRGRGEKVGVKIVGSGFGEVMADGTAFAGACHPGYEGTAYHLQPLAEGAEILTVDPADASPVSVRCGDKVVLGYNPYCFIGTPGYLGMLRELQKALGASVWLEPWDVYECPRVSTWVRADGHRAAVLLINGQTDTAEQFDVCFRGDAKTAELVRPDGSRETLPVRREEGVLKAGIARLAPWEMGVVWFA